MNSNRKRNLKKLARDLVTAAALAGSINAGGTSATENTSSGGVSKGTIVTAATMLLGFGGIGFANYYGQQRSEKSRQMYEDRAYQVKKQIADDNLKTTRALRLATECGLHVDQLTTLCGYINDMKIHNSAEHFITTDDILQAIENGGDKTKEILRAMGGAADSPTAGREFVKKISQLLTNSDNFLSSVDDAVSKLTSTVMAGNLVINSLADVSTALGGNRYAAWEDWAVGGGGDRTCQIGVGAANTPIILTGPDAGFSMMNANYECGKLLLPKGLQPLLGDVLWCGVAVAEPAMANANQCYLKQNGTKVEKLLNRLTLSPTAKQTMKDGNVPMYLMVSVRPDARDANKVLTADEFRLIPLFKNSVDKRGDENSTNLKEKVGTWITQCASNKPESDRKKNDNIFS